MATLPRLPPWSHTRFKVDAVPPGDQVFLAVTVARYGRGKHGFRTDRKSVSLQQTGLGNQLSVCAYGGGVPGGAEAIVVQMTKYWPVPLLLVMEATAGEFSFPRWKG